MSKRLQRRLRQIASVTCLLLAAACGGGDGSNSSVSNLVANNLRIGSVATISAQGRNLLAARMRVDGPCIEPVRSGASTDEVLQYTCSVQGLGTVRATVLDAGSSSIGELTAQVLAPRVNVDTTKGSFIIDLDFERAPKTVLNYAPNATTGVLTAKTSTRAGVALESNNGLKHVRGAVGLIRGAELDSGKFRWFVDTAANPDLDYVDDEEPGLVVFGHVNNGLDVVDAISAVEVRPDLVLGLGALPVSTVTISSITQIR
jgi:peptidyl-prolyl cis-trans isomerase A (cyclophilin A)